MKTAIIALTLTLFAANSAFATSTGGFEGPGLAPVSVAEAKKLRDDTNVVMIGNIVKSIGDEKYEFTDGTDVIIVEIDNDLWNGVKITPNDKIEIQGEVDTKMFKNIIDVDAIVKK